MNLGGLSDTELLASLDAVCANSRRLLAKLLAHLVEIDERRLAEKSAYPSLFEFCIRRLGMSDGEACRRIAAARLVKRFPTLLARVESGELNLTTLHLVRDVLTDANAETVADAASGKTKRQVEELVARLAPKPDVPDTVLPALAVVNSRVSPLAEERYEVRFTADRALKEKIERAKDLLRHCHPDGELAAIMHRAFDTLIEKLEKTRRAKTSRPQRNPKPAKPSTVTNEVRRAVFERDGEQCTFVDAEGNRCPARDHLELDHTEPEALGGAPTRENLRVLCRPHNRLRAEQVFGKQHVEEKIREQRWQSLRAQAHRGLVNLGFRPIESNRALDQVANAHHHPPPIETILREALSVLTSR